MMFRIGELVRIVDDGLMGADMSDCIGKRAEVMAIYAMDSGQQTYDIRCTDHYRTQGGYTGLVCWNGARESALVPDAVWCRCETNVLVSCGCQCGAIRAERKWKEATASVNQGAEA